MKRLLLLTLAVLGIVAIAGTVGLPGRAVAQAPAPTTDTVTVSGTGTVTAVPDVAQMSFGVETRRPTAQAAVAANGDAMQKVIAAIRLAGARKIATQWVSVYPYTSETGAVEGYAASNTVSAESDVADAPRLIDSATAAGANQVSGPGLTSANAEGLYRQALAKAVDVARAHAQVLVTAAGRQLGAITAIVESGAQAVPVYDKGAVPAAAASTPVEPGQQETSATVSVTFSLR
jgi:uncharacterized protein YggE